MSKLRFKPKPKTASAKAQAKRMGTAAARAGRKARKEEVSSVVRALDKDLFKKLKPKKVKKSKP